MFTGEGSYLARTFRTEENRFLSPMSIFTKWTNDFPWFINGNVLLNSNSDTSFKVFMFKLFTINILFFLSALKLFSRFWYEMFKLYFFARSIWMMPSKRRRAAFANITSFFAEFYLLTSQIMLAKGIKVFQGLTAPSSISSSSQKLSSFKIKSTDKTTVVYLLFLTFPITLILECFEWSWILNFISSTKLA